MESVAQTTSTIGSGERIRQTVTPLDPSPEEESVLKPKFCLSDGQGEKLSTFSGWQTTSRREAEQLESALELIHMLVYNRRGVKGQRRGALADFCGVAESERKRVEEKVAACRRTRLKSFLGAFDFIGSGTHSALVERVVNFILAPTKDHLKRARSTVKRNSRRSKKEKSEAGQLRSSEERCRSKKGRDDSGLWGQKMSEESSKSTRKGRSQNATKKEGAEKPKEARTKHKSAQSLPSEDTIRAAVYRSVLTGHATEVATLSLKSLRHEIETMFGLASDSLKAHTGIIEEVAKDCAVALTQAMKSGNQFEPHVTGIGPE